MATHTHPQILVDTTPGATKAQEALNTEIAERVRLNSEHRSISNRMVAASTRQNGALVKKPEIATADYDALTAANVDMNRMITAQDRRVDAAHKHLDELIHSLSPEERKTRTRKIAAHTLTAHARAIQLWEELQSVLSERDTAYSAIGRPGQDWKKAHGAVPNRFDGGVTDVSNIMEARVGHFDIETLSILAAGETVPTEAEKHAAAQAHAAKTAAETALAIRKRR